MAAWVSGADAVDEGWSDAPSADTDWYPPNPRITVSGKKLLRNGVEFKPWGFQPLHHDEMDDFYTTGGNSAYTREMLEGEVRALKQWGGNTLRQHLMMWDFIEGYGPGPETLSVKATSLEGFLFVVDACRKEQIYVLPSVTCTWEPAQIPAWYDALDYRDRWEITAWWVGELVGAIKDAGLSSTILGYELANEPLMTEDPDDKDWYVPDPAGSKYYFNEYLAKGVETGGTPALAREWLTKLSTAVKTVDPDALTTVALISIYADTGTFGRANLEDLVDFLEPHLYPHSHDPVPQGAIDLIEAWTAGPTPVVMGETMFFLGEDDAFKFMDAILPLVQGYLFWSYGYGPDEFTFPPDPVKYPATNNASLGYAFQWATLVWLESRQDMFLPQEAQWQQLQ